MAGTSRPCLEYIIEKNKNSPCICLLLLLDIIDRYNLDQISLKEIRSFIFRGLILVGT
jgi:hypothetical protein